MDEAELKAQELHDRKMERLRREEQKLAELRARLDASQEALASALERLAAAEKVVSAARLITSPHGPVTGSRDWEMAWHQLEDALAAYQETSGETRS